MNWYLLYFGFLLFGVGISWNATRREEMRYDWMGIVALAIGSVLLASAFRG